MKKYMYRMANHNRKGFSLVELVVVILIIAILAAAIFLGGATVIKQSRESALRNDLRNYGTYVQDMFYANPDMQANSGKYNTHEGFTFNPKNYTFSYSNEAFNEGTPAQLTTTATTGANLAAHQSAMKTAATGTLKILKVLNQNFLTTDFQLDGSKLDPWDNAYCYSYAMSPSTDTGDPASCIIVINSLGVNSLDETSDASTTPAKTLGESALGVVANYTKDLGDTYKSATDIADAIEGKTGDDYGVIIVMIGGQVSTAYYGFN